MKSAPEQQICFPLVRAVPQGTLTSVGYRRGNERKVNMLKTVKKFEAHSLELRWEV